MSKINYIKERDELEILFKEVEVPEVVKLSSGIIFEFDDTALSAIILPNFFQMIHRSPTPNMNFELIEIDENTLKIKLNEQIINVKLNLYELEK